MFFLCNFRCSCGNCSTELMANPKECCCCHEIENCFQFIQNFSKENEKGPLKCVIDHPGFPAMCLYRWSLELAAENYRTRDGHHYRQTGAEERYCMYCKTVTNIVFAYLKA